MPDDVQPGEGQGGGGDGGLFDSYLQTVPEDARETVASYLKDASSKVDGRLQEAAEFRKQWEPYQGVEALTQYQPDELQQLLAWHQHIASGEDAYKQWLTNAAKEAGLTLAEAEELSEEGAEGLTKADVQKLIAEQASQQVAPLQQQLEQFQQQQAIDLEADAIRKVWGELEAEHKLQLTDEQKETVLELGMAKAVDERGNDLPMGDASWVKAGFDRYQKITGGAQQQFVADKLGQPKIPLSQGASEAGSGPKTFDEAKEQALARLRQVA